jgi:phosphoglycolate phosphatase-like HAD superfamily hydrolase
MNKLKNDMKLFVWDFHGVLEKDNELAVIIVTNKILENAGYKERLSKKSGDNLYGKKWFQYFEYLLPYENHEKHMELTYKCFDYSNSNPKIIATYIKPNDNVVFVLDEISKKHDQILVSNTQMVSLNIFVDSIGIGKYFPIEKRFATDSHTDKNAKNKAQVVEEYIAKKNFEEIITIGDSIEEKFITDRVGGKFFLYTHIGKNFRECNCEHKIRDLRDIIREI